MKPIVFITDDDQDDKVIFVEALEETAPNIKHNTFTNGIELTQYLDSKDAVLPDILFLDLNMPGMDGVETLTKLRKEKRFGKIRIVIYSTSSSKIDIMVTSKLGADAYITKPTAFAKIKEIIKTVLSIDWNKRKVNPENFVLNSYER